MASQEAGAGVVAGVRRPPLDAWSVREQLCLASAVTRTGDQSWVSVARALRPLAATTDRPSDWFGHRSCAAQYGALLEKCRTPRRKKRLPDGSSPSPIPITESPQEAILNRLTDDRIAELQALMAEDVKQYAALKAEIKELTTGAITESRIRVMAAAMEAEVHAKEVEAVKHNQWLREREERRAILERTWRRSDSDTPHPSPLLTSLLQSSAPVHQTASLENNRPVVISTTATTKPVENIITSISDSMGSNKVPYHELQKIEQIKSELQKIEQNLIEGSMATEPILPSLHSVPPSDLSAKDQGNVETLKTPEKIDIDDIEIKAEDVYAFSDIDLDIPPVSSMHKTTIGRPNQTDKNLFNKRDLSNNADLDDLTNSEQDNLQEINIVTPQPQTLSEINEAIVGNPAVIETTDHSKDNVESDKRVEDTAIKVESIAPETNTDENMTTPAETEIKEEKSEAKLEDDKASESSLNIENNESQDVETQKSDKDASENSTESQSTDKDAENKSDKSDSSKPVNELLESNIETDDDTPIEVIKEDKPGKTKRDYSRKKTEKDERSSPPRELEGLISNKMEFSDEVGSDNSQESADKKLLSRRFRPDRGSRSESPATPNDSLPNSPAPNTPPCTSTSNASSNSVEQDKDYRIWKKSVIQALNRLLTLKYASLFMKPITDDQAPGYSQAVKKPMDLSTIRRNIDLGVTRNTQDFQRDILLMLTNALMYNRTDHRVYTMTRETIQDAISQITLLLQAQAHAAAENTSLARLTRPPRPASRSAGGAVVKRKRGNTSGGSDTPTNIKKRRADDS